VKGGSPASRPQGPLKREFRGDPETSEGDCQRDGIVSAWKGGQGEECVVEMTGTAFAKPSEVLPCGRHGGTIKDRQMKKMSLREGCGSKVKIGAAENLLPPARGDMPPSGERSGATKQA